MTKDETIKLAREAAAKHGHTLREVPQTETVELLVEFYTMATALEREAMLDLVDSYAKNNTDLRDAIRARGKP
jgi:hypothetical protein